MPGLVVRTLIFVLVAPGAVLVLIPIRILDASGDRSDAGLGGGRLDHPAPLGIAEGVRLGQVPQRVVRLGAKARAAGIHLILATQHPDAKTVTGRLQAHGSRRRSRWRDLRV